MEQQIDEKITNFYVFISSIIPENEKTKLSSLDNFKLKIYEILPLLPDDKETINQNVD